MASSSDARVTAPTPTTTGAVLVAAASDREGLMIFNDSTVTLLIKLGSGAAASTTDYSYKIPTQTGLDISNLEYKGPVSGVLSGADAAARARITEVI